MMPSSPDPASKRWVHLTAAALLALGLSAIVAPGSPPSSSANGARTGHSPGVSPAPEKCLNCHQGIEEMHPWHELTCTACHGGDPTAETVRGAHIQPSKKMPQDERLLPADFDTAYLQFLNPSDLRVVSRTCDACHTEAVEDVIKSMHGTTAGHLSDSLYENGLTQNRRDRYGIFAVRDTDGEIPEHGYASMPGYLTT